ncbi:stilbene synthase [Anopheles sinensis]|uniref:Stilbene synthase n=1 Tax=Anopheles sinensis TaxID=74873 RepID=A0A084VV54_ANOSI|nr:stilbene synthase [Anopheles sinensis]
MTLLPVHWAVPSTLGVLLLSVVVIVAEPLQPCYVQYRKSQLVKKSIDFENPSVFELLASNYSHKTSPFFELLHRERECIALSYWINNEPESQEFRGNLHFSCGIQELLRIDLLHVPNGQAADGYCLSMRHADRPLEHFACAGFGLTRTAPLTLQAHVGSMVILSQETAHGFEYLLFQRVRRHDDMLNTLMFFEEQYSIPQGSLTRRSFYTSTHWVRCDCERLVRSMSPLYQCLGINRNRFVRPEFSIPSLSEDMLVMAAIGIAGGVTCFLLLKIRSIC